MSSGNLNPGLLETQLLQRSQDPMEGVPGPTPYSGQRCKRALCPWAGLSLFEIGNESRSWPTEVCYPTALATELVHLFKPGDFPELCPGRAAERHQEFGWGTWIPRQRGILKLYLRVRACMCVSVWVGNRSWTFMLGRRLWPL